MHTETESKVRPLRGHEINLIWAGLVLVKAEQLAAERTTREEAGRLRAAGLVEEAAAWERVADNFEAQAERAAHLLDCIDADALTGLVDVTAWAEWVAGVER